jgi:hypothetical protein
VQLNLSTGVITLGVSLSVYLVGISWYAAQLTYRVDSLEKAAVADKLSAYDTRLLNDEWGLKEATQRLNNLDNYLRSHPWATAASAGAALAPATLAKPEADK